MTAAGLCTGQVISAPIFDWSLGQAIGHAYWSCFGIFAIWLCDRFWSSQ